MKTSLFLTFQVSSIIYIEFTLRICKNELKRLKNHGEILKSLKKRTRVYVCLRDFKAILKAIESAKEARKVENRIA